MEPLTQLKTRLEGAVPGAVLEIIPNRNPEGQDSLTVDRGHALAVAQLLRDDPQLRLDYASNVTGVDWPDRLIKTKVKVKRLINEVEKEFEEVVQRQQPGYLEAVYHLYSMTLKHGPVVLRQRTADRHADVHLTSLTPVWRSAELQEREIYDLFGVIFDGHPDLRRILMWEGFKDHPMRKDYQEPDDYEWEPTPHDEVLAKARRHYPPEAGL